MQRGYFFMLEIKCAIISNMRPETQPLCTGLQYVDYRREEQLSDTYCTYVFAINFS
jgi:hypothetical protein